MPESVRGEAEDPRVEPIHPRWSTWTFLVYASGAVALAALEGWLGYLSARWSDAAYAGAALVVFLVAAVLASILRRRAHPVAAGVFAFVAVVAFAAFAAALWTWLGWFDSGSTDAFRGFYVGRLLLLLVWLVAALVALGVFRFPLLLVQVILAGWIFTADLVSNGGWWSAVVTIVVGLFLLAVARSVDAGPSRPYGMWLHVGAGLLIGGSVLWFLHGGDVEWTLIVIASVAYILLAEHFERSSWAVLGTLGLLIAASHFALEWTRVQLFFFTAGSGTRPWASPLVATILALLLLALGLRSGRRDTAPS